MDIICLDLEGVLIPEIWITVAEQTGIEAFKATTRDIPDYHQLMQQRLRLLAEHDLKLNDIQAVIASLSPLVGAADFLNELRAAYQVIILSDTFYDFAKPLMAQLNWPTLFCHQLIIADDGTVTNYRLRQQDAKRQSIEALHSLNYRVFAAGDSYNDTTMLAAADQGFLFRAPENVMAEFPEFPVTTSYTQLRHFFDRASAA